MKNMPTILIKSISGYTIIELLIAAVITAIITAASFGFYTSMHRQSEVQIDVSEIQHICRASLFDIRKTLHMAGNRLGSSQVPYRINGDTLSVFFSETKAVDTVSYFLTEFTTSDYAKVPNLPAGQKIYRLMKKRNSADPAVFADFVNDVNFVVIDATSMAVTITAQSSSQDPTILTNNGYRTFSLGERVNLRYLQLL